MIYLQRKLLTLGNRTIVLETNKKKSGWDEGQSTTEMAFLLVTLKPYWTGQKRA